MRDLNLTSSSKIWGGDHQWSALALSGDLQTQQISTAGQITDRVTLDRITPSLVHQRGERDEIELAVRRDQQPAFTAKQRAERLKYFRVNGASQALHVHTPRVARRLAERRNGRIYCLRIAQFLPLDLSVAAQDVGHITRLSISRSAINGFGVEWVIGSEFNQRRIGRDSRSHSFQ